VFNRTYILVYPPEMQPLVESILGPQMNDEVMWQEALARSEREVQEDPTNAHAWFNLGTNLLAQARYDEAARAYDRARVEGLPWRMLWYQFGPFEAYYGAGRYRELLALAEATLDTTSQLEEVHYWRGMALSAVGELQRARESLERAVSLRPNYPEAHAALQLLSEEAGGE
jgi:tetratricopeptide (TPR) repeat protein